MSGWDGSGNWNPPYTWANEAALGNPISATKFDALNTDIKSGFQNCITRDGQGKPSSDISWNSHRISDLQDPASPQDAVTLIRLLDNQQGTMFNRVISLNGNFDVWQAGTTFTGTAARLRTADGWWAKRDSSATGYTVSRVAGVTWRYGLKWQRDAANASTAVMRLGQSLETAECAWLGVQSAAITLRVLAKAGANYSGGSLTLEVISGTGTDQNVLDGLTGAVTEGTSAVTLTTFPAWYTLSIPVVSANATGLGWRLSWTPSGVAGADDSITIYGVQVEWDAGSVNATGGAIVPIPFAVNLARCQRYYQKGFPYATTPAQNAGTVGGLFFASFKTGASPQNTFYTWMLRTQMRSSGVTMTLYNPSAANSQVRDLTAAADCSASTASLNSGGDAFTLSFTGNASTSSDNRLHVNWVASDDNF